MKEHLIGYFDLLGYKQFIQNNTEEHTARRVGHILRDIETSLSLNRTKPINRATVIADLEYSRVNCLNISDTIIFWIDNFSEDSVINFLKVCYQLNYMLNLYEFPSRGVIILDKFDIIKGSQQNSAGFFYSPNIMYGKGLLNAHIKAESFNMAGTFIDKSFIDRFIDDEKIMQKIDELTIQYQVPFKPGIENTNEYVFKLVKDNLNEKRFNNVKEDIKRVFTQDNKGLNESVQLKIENTIKFLEKHPWDNKSL